MLYCQHNFGYYVDKYQLCFKNIFNFFSFIDFLQISDERIQGGEYPSYEAGLNSSQILRHRILQSVPVHYSEGGVEHGKNIYHFKLRVSLLSVDVPNMPVFEGEPDTRAEAKEVPQIQL